MAMKTPIQTITNPHIPFVGTILGGLVPGEMIVIQGSVPADADRFQVDLTCGSSTKPRADVAFHFNPRFKKSCIVCNSLLRERWGREEILYQMPFKPGVPFEIIMLLQKDLYKVAVNGGHVLEYKHRVDLRKVDTINISGKVHIQTIGFIINSAPAQPVGIEKSLQVHGTLTHSGDLNLPFQATLEKGLAPGLTVVIKGQVNLYPDSFFVNLCVGGTKDIALHLNPRLKAGSFVRNSYLSGGWGEEETHLAAFPFKAGEYFEMIILCDAQEFKVAVNGVHQLCYRHRVKDLSRVTRLEIAGDIQLLHAQAR
ncbi:galectin-8 [Engraulis encrasicolus]|uniref:galectin-8 n=1 Tax=Engraulis encrasicolus TaxID=184585 RepID=UPI002FCF9B03